VAGGQDTDLEGKGVDPNARTAVGQSAYNLAQDNGDAAMTALLAGQGVDQSPQRFPELRGPWLGQKPPGRTPGVFAPGIVSARFGLHSTIRSRRGRSRAAPSNSASAPIRGSIVSPPRLQKPSRRRVRWRSQIESASARTSPRAVASVIAVSSAGENVGSTPLAISSNTQA
jgi:hypothetical protein